MIDHGIFPTSLGMSSERCYRIHQLGDPAGVISPRSEIDYEDLDKIEM